MDLAAVVAAVEALMSPLEWDTEEAWLAESVRLVRGVRGSERPAASTDPAAELETLLRLPGDEPGWLRAALASPLVSAGGPHVPATAETSEAVLQVATLRCGLAAGLATLHRANPTLPTTQELRVQFGLRGREPQVALLAAEGLTNAAIAERLRLSAHTVRHYLERVLDRLGLHTRKRLALHLMGGGERQPPRRRTG